jgi:hypothetical protein
LKHKEKRRKKFYQEVNMKLSIFLDKDFLQNDAAPARKIDAAPTLIRRLTLCKIPKLIYHLLCGSGSVSSTEIRTNDSIPCGTGTGSGSSATTKYAVYSALIEMI